MMIYVAFALHLGCYLCNARGCSFVLLIICHYC